MTRVRQTLSALALATIVVVCGCGFGPSRQIGTVFPPGAAGGRPALPIDVIDPGGHVRAIAVGAPDGVGNFDDGGGLFPVPGRPTSAVMTWGGGACDVRMTATVELRETTIVVALQRVRRAGTCTLQEIFRTVTFEFNEAIGGRTLVREYDPAR